MSATQIKVTRTASGLVLDVPANHPNTGEALDAALCACMVGRGTFVASEDAIHLHLAPETVPAAEVELAEAFAQYGIGVAVVQEVAV
jgi:hypothetical protein